MTTTKPEVTPTGRYSITETAKYIGVSKRTIQRYIEKGILKVQYRKANNKPFATGLEILKVWNQTY